MLKTLNHLHLQIVSMGLCALTFLFASYIVFYEGPQMYDHLVATLALLTSGANVVIRSLYLSAENQRCREVDVDENLE
jgi:hypothetical protein